jgi:hypothetical protein
LGEWATGVEPVLVGGSNKVRRGPLRLLAVMTVATGSVVGGLMANAAPNSLDTMPEARGTASAVLVHGMGMMGYECIWYKGCRYCRACAECQWPLQYCKKHHG